MNAFITLLNDGTDVWLATITRGCWYVTIALAVAWIVCRLGNRLPAWVRCWIWRIAYLKVLAALIWTAPVEVAVLPAPEWTPMTEIQVSTSLSTATVAPVVEASPSWRVATGILTAWIVGVGWQIFRLAGDWRWSCNLQRTAGVCTDERICRSLKQAADRFGMHRLPRLFVSDRASTPMLIGAMRPAIVLPTGFAGWASRSEIETALAHELAHVLRRDLLWSWLPIVASTLFFFHPLVWLAQREWQFASESACDELAVRNGTSTAAEYARMLVRIATDAPRTFRWRTAALGTLGSFHTLKRRLIAMERMNHYSARWLRTTGITLVLAGAVSIVPWRLTAQEPADVPDLPGPPTRTAPALPPAPLREADATPVFTIECTIGATDAQGRDTVVSSPRITALENSTATVQVGSDHAVPLPGVDKNAVEHFACGILMHVTPSDAPDGRIYLNADIKITDKPQRNAKSVRISSRSTRIIETVDADQTVEISLGKSHDGKERQWARFRVMRGAARGPSIERITVVYAIQNRKAEEIAERLIAKTRDDDKFKIFRSPADKEGSLVLTAKPVAGSNKLVVSTLSNRLDDVSELIRQLDVNE